MTDHRSTAIVVAGAACELRIGDEKIRDSFSGEDQADSMAYALGLLAASRHPRWIALDPFGGESTEYCASIICRCDDCLPIQPCALGEIGIFPRIGHAGRLYVLDDSRHWDWRDVVSDEKPRRIVIERI